MERRKKMYLKQCLARLPFELQVTLIFNLFFEDSLSFIVGHTGSPHNLQFRYWRFCLLEDCENWGKPSVTRETTTGLNCWYWQVQISKDQRLYVETFSQSYTMQINRFDRDGDYVEGCHKGTISRLLQFFLICPWSDISR